MVSMSSPVADSSNRLRLIGAWLLVGIPFAWGVIITIGNAAALFR